MLSVHHTECVCDARQEDMFSLCCAGSTVCVGTQNCIAAERGSLLCDKGIVVQYGTVQNGSGGETVTLRWNGGLRRVTLGIITAELY
jgi:hypothetical protein